MLKIFLALLPMLLTFMNKRAGMQSLAEIDFGVFQKYFIFQARCDLEACSGSRSTAHWAGIQSRRICSSVCFSPEPEIEPADIIAHARTPGTAAARMPKRSAHRIAEPG